MTEALIIQKSGIEIITQEEYEGVDERDKERIIEGLFYSPFSDEVVWFLGTFHYSKAEPSNAIDGFLEDFYGNSKINGFFKKEENIKFDKVYHGRPPISYELEFNQKVGLYVGTWKGKDAFEGHSVCRIGNWFTQQDTDFAVEYFKSFPIITSEQKAQLLIGHMVGEGYLDVSRDESGKEMFSISEEGRRLARKTEEKMSPEEREYQDYFVKRAIQEVDKPDD